MCRTSAPCSSGFINVTKRINVHKKACRGATVWNPCVKRGDRFLLRPICLRKQNAKDASLQILSLLLSLVWYRKGVVLLFSEETRRWKEVYWDLDGTLNGTPKSYTTWADACSTRQDLMLVCPDWGPRSTCLRLLLGALLFSCWMMLPATEPAVF